MNNKIDFYIFRDVKSPTRDAGNVGYDFFVPEFDKDFMDTVAKEAEQNPRAALHIEDGKIVIKPGEHVSIPSGVKTYFAANEVLNALGLDIDLIATNKSGIASKKSLLVGACLIDPNYQGECHIGLHNVSEETVYIAPGDKVVQFKPELYIKDATANIVRAEDTPLEDFYEGFRYGNRGEGWAGSTGTR